MKKRIFYSIGILLLVVGCGDFLAEKSQDQALVTSCSDLEEVLVCRGYMEVSGGITSVQLKDLFLPYLHVMDDDVQEVRLRSEGDAVKSLENYHHWAAVPNITNGGNEMDDAGWPKLYDHINVANIIIAQTGLFPEDPVGERLKGECYFLRAYNYFMLVNLYGKPYAKATAGTDLGVPVKVTEWVEDIHYTRNTVAEVYEQIVTDLKEAIRCLAGKKAQMRSNYQAGEAAVRALLGRVYLYMGEYALSLEQTTHPIFDTYALADLNTFTAAGTFLVSSSPEFIFSQGTYNCSYLHKYGFAISESLVGAYGTKDLRTKYFFSTLSSPAKIIIRKTPENDYATPVSDVMTLRFGEVVLNRAEAYALSDQEPEAVEALELLRVNRYEKGEPLMDGALTGRALVDEIRKERRLELCFEGHRWFDLRRYAVHPQWPHSESIWHDHFELSGRNEVWVGLYELKPYAEEPAWLLPLPGDELVFNEGVLVDNAPREERIMIEEPRN